MISGLICRLCICLAASFLSFAANAAACQDQTGNYVLGSREIQIRQNGCKSLVRTEISDGHTIRETIILDGKYHRLLGMPDYQTAFTYDNTYRVGIAKLITTGKVIKIFNSYISEKRN